ncbi:flagellar protein FlaG [Acetivibrio mesophilus]|uniref:Flagellar protein FlaG n=1 Tax=Acetivibrio mesophilus TaxID=2487273 RepID=A0A4Q0I4T6_9FIRM|nr:flagellar protein FlaG [Acetivibrio mesophilus]ODM27347.1 flagellar biosynthesis protein FlaG [Clostridium sp. Bc-iso-3]RXE58817.1 flagellar protein FlaG [Acetivibrio mesophilus]HHV28950.1 flagellar protein FlaG [Clostridium sp.]
MKIQSMDAASLQISGMRNNDHRTNTINSGNNLAKEASNTKKVYGDASLAEREKNEKNLSEKTIIEAIEKANKAITGNHTQLEFSIHEKSKEIMVKVIDSETQEVIREIPPEKILDMVAAMLEMAGIIVDERG